MSTSRVQRTTRWLLTVAGEAAGTGTGALARVLGAAVCPCTAQSVGPSDGPATWRIAAVRHTYACFSSASGGSAPSSLLAQTPGHLGLAGGLACCTTPVLAAGSNGASASQQRTSTIQRWRGCSCNTRCSTGSGSGFCSGLQLCSSQPFAASFRNFASSAGTGSTSTSSSVSRGFCSRGSSSSSSNSDGSSSKDDGEGAVGQERGVEPGATPLAAIQPRIVMVFTCTKCDTRSTKAFSKQSYQKGVVLVRCPGCQKLHLVADHLGWFGEEPFVLHEHVAQLGGNVVRIAADDPRKAAASAAVAAAQLPTASAVAPVAAAGVQQGGKQPSATGTDPADPGLAARTAAAVAAAVSSEGGLFELSDESQVRAALAEARELKEQHHHRQQHRAEPEREQ